MSAGSAVPSQAKMLPREIEENSIILKRKPGASIFYSKVLRQQNETRGVLIVFLNGLMTDKSSWLPVMTGIIEESKAKRRDIPSMLAYDRYGQGLTEDRDPQDMGKEQGHGHDVADAAKDLHDLIHQLAPNGYRDIVLVGNSIGCAIARLYAADHSVSAVLLLDSIMANSNFDLWPDPDAPGFDKASLPEDVTVEALREQRAKFLAIFRPDIPNREGLSRRDLPKLLPRSDEPKLRGASGRPFLTVIGHDFETFAEEGLRVMGTPKSLTMQYTNPVWHQYNEGLVKLTEHNLSKGPLQAKGCGHFIQRDDPMLVVNEVLDLVLKIRLER